MLFVATETTHDVKPIALGKVFGLEKKVHLSRRYALAEHRVVYRVEFVLPLT